MCFRWMRSPAGARGAWAVIGMYSPPTGRRAREHPTKDLLIQGGKYRPPVSVFETPPLDIRGRSGQERRENVVDDRMRRHCEAIAKRDVLIWHQTRPVARERRAGRDDDSGDRGVAARYAQYVVEILWRGVSPTLVESVRR